MAQVEGLNNFNNLLFNTKKAEIADILEHKNGKVGPDLRPKVASRPTEVLTSGISQINGKVGDILYVPPHLNHSRPYYNYDSGFDPTINNAVKNKFVDVSGLLIANKYMKNHNPMLGTSGAGLKSYGVIY